MIKYLPSELLKKIAPGSKIEKALKKNLSLKKAALTNASQFDFLDPKAIERVALKTVKGYKARVKDGEEVAADLEADPALLIQRVQNEVIWQVKEEIKSTYSGEFYTWLPSDADEPDPEHQLNYGLTFQIGVGEMPGDRYGCRCGAEINVDASSLGL